jgi:protoporphyrinogen oxidase
MILGGGISGLYSAYQLLKKNPDRHLIIIDKRDRWGGRVFTYKDKFMTVETGAGRFNNRHTLLIDLIHELNLKQHIIPSSSDYVYIHPSPYTLKTTLLKITTASQIDPFHDLKKMSFLEYASKLLPLDEVQFIEDSFGYYAELVIMNAKDAIRLMQELFDSTFYELKGGLSQIIDELVRRIYIFPNVEMKLNETVLSIKKKYIITTDKGVYHTDFCICTLPKDPLMKLTFSKPIWSKLSKITCAPLCRIYATFEKPWILKKKMTSSSPLRMILPYSKNTVMISYSDYKYALFWNDVYSKKGEKEVIRVLQHYIREEFGIEMPIPIKLKFCFWTCGVGYWNIGADSKVIAKQLQEPFPHFYLCGEHYSATHQQWIEGALETSKSVCEKIKY